MLEFHVAFLVLFVGTTAFFTGLSLLNLRYGERMLAERREWVREELGFERSERVAAYLREHVRLTQFQTWTFAAVVLAALYSGALAGAVEWLEGLGFGPVLTGVWFFVGLVVALRLFGAPFEFYETFVVEERFGFNRQTTGLFVRDLVLGTLVSAAFTAVLAAGVLWFVSALPAYWWLAALALFAAFSIASLVIYPRFVAPLFNDFEPVEEGTLREAVERVAERAGFSTSGIYVMDASRRSSHSNAYFVGFGRTKRVVLFDTLVERMELPEIEAVLAHEFAHWKRAHVWKQFGASVVRAGVVLFALWYLLGTDWLYGMFGLPETPFVGLAVGALWIQPLAKLSRPLENRLSLAHEREADAFAAEVTGGGKPLADALCRLATENLSNPFPHPWYAAFHYTHPPIPERVRYLRAIDGDEADDGIPQTADGAD